MTLSPSNNNASSRQNPDLQDRAGGAGSDPGKWPAFGTIGLFSITLPILLVVLFQTVPEPPKPAWSLEAVSLGVSPLAISSGELTYKSTCAICHAPNGEGLHLLGKPLRNSAFVQSQSDDELLQLLIDGRAINDELNTSGALMPPRSAQNVSDERLAGVVLYLRAIQDMSAPTASTEAWNLKGLADGGASLAAVELGEHNGYDLFVASCSACHGQGADGVEGLGLPLSTSGFVKNESDKDLVTFIKSGRPIWDANNTTGLDMPPKGGNPAVSDEQLQIIVDYIRAVQDEAMGS